MSSDSIGNTNGTSGLVSVNGSVQGTIGSSTDQDWYAVTLIAGRHYQFDLASLDPDDLGTGLNDPLFRLRNSTTVLATQDDYGYGLDSRITFYAASGGTYYLSAEGEGGSTGDYSLAVTDLDFAGEIAATTATTGTVAVNGVRAGVLGHGNDQDWYRVTLTAGRQYRFGALGLDSEEGTLDDPFLRLLNSLGQPIAGASDDDSGVGLDARIAYTATQTGTFYLSVQSAFGDGGSFVLEVDDVTASSSGDVPGTTASASTITPLGIVGGAPVNGTLHASGDQDWYRITLEAGHEYRFDLNGYGTGDRTLDDPFLRLLSGAGVLLDSNDDAFGTLDSSVAFVAGSSGTYFLSAQGFGSGTGTFTLTATDLGEVAADAVPGGTGSGEAVDVGGSVLGVIDSSSDQDWYQVTLEAGREYRFDLSGQGSLAGTLLDPYLRLLDSSGTELEYNDDAPGTLESSMTFTASSSDTYFLSAQGFGSSLGTYQLSVTDLDPALADVPGGPETGAAAVMDGSVEGSIDFDGDDDWYAIDLVAGYAYRFDLLGVDSAAGTLDDPFLMLFDDTGEIAGSDDDGGTGLESALVFTSYQTATYYLSANAFGSSEGTFRLDVTNIDPPQDLVPGDDTTPYSATLGEALTGAVDTGGDQDWYEISLVEDQQYLFNLLGAGSGQGTLDDPYLWLYDSASNEVASNDDIDLENGDFDSSILYTATSTGTYYLSAEGYSTNLGSYRLEALNLTSPVDVPGSLDTGSELWVGYYLEGSIDPPGDQDWYRVELEAGHYYDIELLELENLGLSDPYLRFLDETGAEISTDDDGGDFGFDSRLVMAVEESGNYFLSAEGFGGATGDYRIQVVEADLPEDTATLASVEVGGSVTGTVDEEFEDDWDWFRVELEEGHEYQFDLLGLSSFGGTLLDPYLRLLDGTGEELDFNDDADGSLDSSITWLAGTTGTYFLSAEGYFETGTYTLSVTEVGGFAYDGTPDADALVGSAFNDDMFGDAGDDLLDGKEGDDYLDGDTGDDVLAGGAGNDRVYGWDGDDFFVTNPESRGDDDDDLYGEAGNDVFHDHYGHNLLDGGEGDDFFSVFTDDEGSNLVFGGEGVDTWKPLPGMTAAAGLSYVVADFTAGVGGDLLDVSALLDESVAAGHLQPGESAAGFIRLLQSGADTHLQWNLDGAGGDWVTQLVLETTDNDKVTASNFTGAQEVGSKDSESLNGTLGDDTLVASDGNDTLVGDEGADVLYGGSGGDTYYVDDVKDVVVEDLDGPGAGALVIGGGSPDNSAVSGIPDLIRAAVSYACANGVEDLTLTGTAVEATGNALANKLIGNTVGNRLIGLSGNDTLSGGNGNDTLDGGAGGDSMNGGSGNDVFIVDVAADKVVDTAGTDTVRSSVTLATLATGIESLLLTGAGAINGTGNTLANTITGNGGNNVLDGKGGADTLVGGAGNDTFVWASTDTFRGDAGVDKLKVASGNMVLTTVANSKIANIEQIDLTGGGNNRLTLNASDVLDLSSTTNTIKVLGAAGDSVDIVGAFTVQGVAAGFRTYKVGTGFLQIDTDIAVI